MVCRPFPTAFPMASHCISNALRQHLPAQVGRLWDADAQVKEKGCLSCLKHRLFRAVLLSCSTETLPFFSKTVPLLVLPGCSLWIDQTGVKFRVDKTSESLVPHWL